MRLLIIVSIINRFEKVGVLAAGTGSMIEDMLQDMKKKSGYSEDV